MRNIRELLDLDYNFLLILLVGILTFILGTLILSVFKMIFAPVFKARISDIDALGFKFSKQRGGKWDYRGHKPGISFSVYPVFDLDKFGEMDSKKMKAYDNAYVVFNILVDLVAAAAFFVLGVNGAINIESELLATISMIFGISYAVFSLVRIVVSIIVLIRSNSTKTLAGYQQAAITMIRAGIPMEKLDLKSTAELGFTKASRTEKLMYFGVYFAYLDASGQYDKMAAAVGEAEQNVGPNSGSKIDLMAYAILVYYYSYFYVDPSRAKDYYHRGGDYLDRDKDSNSMRIKGFYELNCFGNVEKARECAQAAQDGIEKFSMGSEREYERQCIAKLFDAISRFQG